MQFSRFVNSGTREEPSAHTTVRHRDLLTIPWGIRALRILTVGTSHGGNHMKRNAHPHHLQFDPLFVVYRVTDRVNAAESSLEETRTERRDSADGTTGS